MRLAQQMSNWQDDYLDNEHMHFATLLDEVQAAGFTGLEINNALGNAGSPEEIQQQMVARGMEFAGFLSETTIQSFAFPLEPYRKEITLAAQLNIKVLTIPGDFSRYRPEDVNESDYRRFAEQMAEVCSLADKRGLTVAYHLCHGYPVSALDQMQRIWTYLPDLAVCVDLGEFIGMGSDPVELITRHPERIAHVHLRDWHAPGRRFANLGEGDLGNFPRIFRALRQSGYEGWLTVENGEKLMPAGELAIHAMRSVGEGVKSL